MDVDLQGVGATAGQVHEESRLRINRAADGVPLINATAFNVEGAERWIDEGRRGFGEIVVEFQS